MSPRKDRPIANRPRERPVAAIRQSSVGSARTNRATTHVRAQSVSNRVARPKSWRGHSGDGFDHQRSDVRLIRENASECAPTVRPSAEIIPHL